ncbi:MAG: sigma 54-interacting transcriptional regulator [Acidobacteria bacterium]|nr:sigma 54-interacting transcriptional regulator [Acidobacteriota bacterium]
MTATLRIRHQALEAVPDDVDAVGLSESRLNDRQRAGLLLQGAALLAHLQIAGWRLPSWTGVVVDGRGVLRIETGMVRKGRDGRFPQTVLRQFASLLFGSEDMVGRSSVRAALRPVVAGWCDLLLPLPANRLVADILDHAPFLWGDEYGTARRSLVGVHQYGRGEEVVVVGHSRWRRSLLRVAGADLERLLLVLGGGEALDHWLGDRASGGPIDWIAQGDWRRAVDEARREPPTERSERSALARALLDAGQFEAALALVERSDRTEDVLIRLKGQVRMGRLVAARRTLSALEDRRLDRAAKLQQCEEAIRIHAAVGRSAGLRAWAERAREAAVGPLADRWLALAALALREVGAGEEVASLMDRTKKPEDWGSCLARARLAMDGGGFEEAAQVLATALKLFRRQLPVYDRASLWNELAILRLSMDDDTGAERAARVAVRLFRHCDGPAARAAAHGSLAEARMRGGRLDGVPETIDSLRRASLMAGSAAGTIEARQLEARLNLTWGRWSAALESCKSVRDELRKRQLQGGRRRSLGLLSARALVHLGRSEEAREELLAALPLPFGDRSARRRFGGDELPPVLLLAGLPEEARAAGARAACEGLWQAVGESRAPSDDDWRRLEAQGAFRSAMAIHDLVCLGVAVPSRLLGEAVQTLSETGAEALAQRVDSARLGPWRALRSFLDVEELAPGTFHSLLSSAGHPEARIALYESPDVGGEEEPTEVLLAGPGGSEQFSIGAPAGRLVLSADRIDEPARALLAVVATRTASRRPRHVLELGEARNVTVGEMIGRSKVLLAAQERVEKLAVHDLPVLILGESGTGKEMLARQLHESSARASGPWMAVNCAALPEGLLLSDLFGHTKGSFTGADSERIGVFESGDGGTVFLDEVAELPKAAQGMLLRLLQEGEMRRIGESQTRRLDFRLVTATHRDLLAMVEAGEFREDLYYRIRVANVDAPALRDRGDDVMLLADHFLEAFSTDRERLRFSERARKKIREYRWPGNVRELRNAIESAVALAEHPVITAKMLGLRKEAGRAPKAESTSYHRKLERYRRELIRKALADADGNQARAARSLGLSRQALSYLVRKLNYDP